MTHLDSPEYTHDLLKELIAADPPMVVELARQPGQSTTRFAQLLGGPVSAPLAAQAAEAAAQHGAVVGGDRGSECDKGFPHQGFSPQAETSSALDARVRTLEQEVANLQASLAGLRQNLREAGILRDGA